MACLALPRTCHWARFCLLGRRQQPLRRTCWMPYREVRMLSPSSLRECARQESGMRARRRIRVSRARRWEIRARMLVEMMRRLERPVKVGWAARLIDPGHRRMRRLWSGVEAYEASLQLRQQLSRRESRRVELKIESDQSILREVVHSQEQLVGSSARRYSVAGPTVVRPSIRSSPFSMGHRTKGGLEELTVDVIGGCKSALHPARLLLFHACATKSFLSLFFARVAERARADLSEPRFVKQNTVNNCEYDGR